MRTVAAVSRPRPLVRTLPAWPPLAHGPSRTLPAWRHNERFEDAVSRQASGSLRRLAETWPEPPARRAEASSVQPVCRPAGGTG
jgi:hypothetical protein